MEKYKGKGFDEVVVVVCGEDVLDSVKRKVGGVQGVKVVEGVEVC